MKKCLKLSVIGNIASGKTTLSRHLSARYQIPVTHIDSIQFLPHLKMRPYKDTIEILKQIQNQPQWIIDGYGPLDILQERLNLSDKILFLDFTLAHHLWWLTRRQISSLWNPRAELPHPCLELTFAHTKKLYKTLWAAHRQMRPELMRILKRLGSKVVYIQNKTDLNFIIQNGIDSL